MMVSGEEAALFNAVRLDDYTNVNKGPLVSADDQTGCVVYRDTPDSTKTITLGKYAIRIVRAGR